MFAYIDRLKHFIIHLMEIAQQAMRRNTIANI